MNINLVRFKGILRELGNIRAQLSRLNDLYEADLNSRHVAIHIPPTAPDSPEVEFTYTDEELNALQEMLDEERQRRGKLVEE